MASTQTFKPVAATMRQTIVRPGASNVKVAAIKPVSAFGGSIRPFTKASCKVSRASIVSRVVQVRSEDKVVVIGLAADSGCGKSTFMRRVTGIFGGDPKPPQGGNPDSNTLISDMTTVICLDDYHSLDRNGRKEMKVTALAPEAQNFDLMYEQVRPVYSNQIHLITTSPRWRIRAPILFY